MRDKSNNKFNILFLAITVGIIFSVSSCNKIIEVDNPTSKVLKDDLFADDGTATSVVTGLYVRMIDGSSFSSGSSKSLTSLAGLTSDELVNIFPENLLAKQFFDNNILPDNNHILNLWTSAYKVIYQANDIIESLQSAPQLTESVRKQLLGEALFVRAFTFFNLVNTFGDVPLIITTDYRINTSAPRVDISDIYTKMVNDLLEAQLLVGETYPSAERVRPNKAVITALLARIYLYREDWENAEIHSSTIIDNTIYQLEADINNVFKSTSQEAIWQLQPVGADQNSWEGRDFIFAGSPTYYSLEPSLVESFQNEDARLVNWIGTLASGSEVLYFPYKYKIKFTGAFNEYSIVFRLAEQYLLRAEARARQDNLEGGIADLDKVRQRSGLSSIADINPGISKDALLLLIEQERRHELFTEWGHRWFDLKRTDRVNSVLSLIKSDWQTTDALYPLPELEFSRNPNLGDNNPGY